MTQSSKQESATTSKPLITGEVRKTMSFAQAEGIKALPKILDRTEISQQLRSMLWDLQWQSFRPIDRYQNWDADWYQILSDDLVHRQHRPVDELASEYGIMACLKNIFWEGNYVEIFDYLQFVLRHPQCPEGFKENIEYVLEHTMSPWTVAFSGEETTFMERGNAHEGEAINSSYHLMKEHGFDAGASHLAAAVQEFRAGTHASSVRESIHAVESVCKKIAEENTLSAALRVLKDKGIIIHPALLQGFDKIYAYTNDKGGIRHALTESSTDTDATDAQFMIGACASFVSYLISKSRKAGIDI